MNAQELQRLYSLALVTWREARGEPILGKLLVAQTVENRVRDRRWPDTYTSVITQPWQFSAFNKNDPNALKYPDDGDPVWEDCVVVARAVIDAPSKFTTANHYHATSVSPNWADQSKIVNRAGNHVFYEL